MFEINYNPGASPVDGDCFIVFSENSSDQLLLEWDGSGFSFPSKSGEHLHKLSFIGTTDGVNVWSGGYTADQKPIEISNLDIKAFQSNKNPKFEVNSLYRVALRASYYLLSSDSFWMAGRGSMIYYWKLRTRYCGICGSVTKDLMRELALECSSCGELYYPKITPAIIVAITKGNKILLVRKPGWPVEKYALVAGFVEAGESLEEAVHREVREETGIEITNLKYCDSQSWPFPNSHMIAFFAEYRSGEIMLVDEELEEAKWFSVEEIPKSPPGPSVAQRLVRLFIESQNSKLQ